jgi:hypothetical protein
MSPLDETMFAWAIVKAIVIIAVSLSCVGYLIWVAARQRSAR